MDQLVRLANFFAKRPSDLSIRIVRLVYALALGAVFGLGFYDYTLSIWGYGAEYGEYAKYAMLAIPAFWLVWGVSPICLMRRKTAKRVMLSLGGALVVASILCIDPVMRPGSGLPSYREVDPAGTGGISYEEALEAAKNAPPTPSEFPVALPAFFLGLVSLALGATSKFVTSGCLKYKEKITVIRV